MSSTSVGDSPATETPPADLPSLALNPSTGSPTELAPSEIAQEEPSFTRILGMAGAFAAFVGGAALVGNHLQWKQLLSTSMAATFVVLGLVAMLYHAARDTDQEIRRTYGLFALGLLALSVILWVINKSIFPFSALGLFSTLAFTGFFLRHETEPGWRKPFLLILGLVGASMFGCVLYGALFDADFFVKTGLVTGLIGLGFFGSLMGQFGSSNNEGRRVAIGVAAAGTALLGGAILGAVANAGADQFLFPKGMLLACIGGAYLIFALGVLSDVPLVVLVRKELASYFYSPVAYFLLAGMTVIGLMNFADFVSILIPPEDFRLRQRFTPASEPLIGAFFIDGIAGWLAPLCVVPLLTMRLLSEEKRTGTYEVLMSVPVSEFSVVLSKFVAGLTVYMLMWLPWGAYLIGLAGELDKPFEYRPILTFGIALLFTGASFIAMGLFFSSLTRNQIVAAVLTFAAMLFMLLMILFAFRGGATQLWQQIFLKLSFYRVWRDSVHGKIPLHDMILFASIAIFWLFLTVKSLEARKWN